MFDGDIPPPAVQKWNVSFLKLGKSHRYADSGVVNNFWSILDQYIYERRPALLPKSSAVGGAVQGAGAGVAAVAGTGGAAGGR